MNMGGMMPMQEKKINPTTGMAMNKGGMTDTINSYLTKYRTQSEKQYKKRKDGKFLKDKNKKLYCC